MDQLLYVLACHPLCTEGVALSRRDRRWRVLHEWTADWGTESSTEEDPSSQEIPENQEDPWIENVSAGVEQGWEVILASRGSETDARECGYRDAF